MNVSVPVREIRFVTVKITIVEVHFQVTCIRATGVVEVTKYAHNHSIIRGGADKSLARPGRKKLQRQNSRFIQHTPYETQAIALYEGVLISP